MRIALGSKLLETRRNYFASDAPALICRRNHKQTYKNGLFVGIFFNQIEHCNYIIAVEKTNEVFVGDAFSVGKRAHIVFNRLNRGRWRTMLEIKRI